MNPTSGQAGDTARHEAALLTQCAANPRVPPEREGEFPIHVERWGDTGSKVLVIHGGEQSIDAIGGGPGNFSGQRKLGRQGWRLSVPSRPGFGRSPSRGRDDQVADAPCIAAMLRDSGGTHLWGHSFGGAEALLAAATALGSVRSLILIEPDLWPLGEAFPESEMPEPVRAFREGRRRALLASDSPKAYASNFLAGFQPRRGGWSVWLARQVLALLPGLRMRIGCGALQAHEASGAEFLRAIEAVKAAGIPVLLVTGGWDPAHDTLGAWVARLAGGTHTVVPSDNHIVMKANPEGLNERMTLFMRAADLDADGARGRRRRLALVDQAAGTPTRESSSAAVRPVGPALTTRTGSDMAAPCAQSPVIQGEVSSGASSGPCVSSV